MELPTSIFMTNFSSSSPIILPNQMKHPRLYLLLLWTLVLLSGCFKKAVDDQVIYQDILLKPYHENRRWKMNDINYERYSVYELKHWRTFYKRQAEYDITGVDKTDFIYYDLPEYHTLYNSEIYNTPICYYQRQIEDPAQNCDDNDWITWDNAPTAIYDIRLEPDAFREKFSYSSSNKQIKAQNQIGNGEVWNDSLYFYAEEWLFKPDGSFEKYLYLDANDITTCSPLIIKGQWVFNTPFATTESSEIIISYNHSYGVHTLSDTYRLVLFGNNAIKFEKITDEEVEKRSLGIFSRLSLISDEIKQKNDLTQSFPKNGRIKVLLSDFCGLGNDPDGDDVLMLEDEVFLHRSKHKKWTAHYVSAPPLCQNIVSPPLNPNCPKFCNNIPCGKKTAYTTDDDNFAVGTSYQSDCNVLADSSALTVANFANLGGELNVPLSDYFWGMCHDFVGFTGNVNGHVVNYESIVATAINPLTQKTAILIRAKIDGGNQHKFFIEY